MLAQGVPINALDNQGNSALNEAVWNKAQPQILRCLLDNGANINNVTKNNDTVLGTYIYWNDNPQMVRYLLMSGFNSSLLSLNDFDAVKPESVFVASQILLFLKHLQIKADVKVLETADM